MDDPPLLICYDDSNGARHAIEAAAALFPERRAVVVDVAPPLTVVESREAVVASTSNLHELSLQEALSVAHTGVDVARRAGLTADARADVAMSTWEGIVEAADDVAAAAIVIGSRGLRGLREFFEGSVSHEVAERAGRPVMIVPPSRAS